MEDILDNYLIKLKGNAHSSSVTINDFRNKSKIIKNFDFSKYQIINDNNKNFITYKYSDKSRISKYKNVYQYFYDEYNNLDIYIAYIVLFCGKTDDGKTWAINAFLISLKV